MYCVLSPFTLPHRPHPLHVSAMQPAVGAGKLWPCAVDLDFGNPSIRYPIVVGHFYLFQCKVPKEDVVAIAPVFGIQNQVIRVTFKNEETSQEFLSKHYGDQTFTHESQEIKVNIRDSNVRIKIVRLSQIPATMDLNFISKRLNEYGVVHKILWEKYKNISGGDSYYTVNNGWVRAYMILDKHIPSFITIHRYRAMVKYSGQILTCRICDSNQHFSQSCPDKRRNIYQYADDDLRLESIYEPPEQATNGAGEPQLPQPMVSTSSEETPEKEVNPDDSVNHEVTGVSANEVNIVTETQNPTPGDDETFDEDIPAGQAHCIITQTLESVSPNFSVPSRFSPLDSVDPENGETESMDDNVSVTSIDTQEDPQEGPSSKRQKPTEIPAISRPIGKRKTGLNFVDLSKKGINETKLTAAARAELGKKIIPNKPNQPKK